MKRNRVKTETNARTVSLVELKTRLSEYICRVRDTGNDIVILDRGKPIGRLTGLPPEKQMEANIAGLVRAGLVRLPERQVTDTFFEKATAIADENGRLLQKLVDEREDSW